MFDPRIFAAILCTTALLSSTSEGADIYKCTDDDGSLVFSQTPCAKKESVVVKQSSTSRSTDCAHANKFAVATARLMRRGLRSDEVFDRYGGLDVLSNGSVGVINYVYTFRTNAGVSTERIAGLALAKCQARSFGDVSCEKLPLSFTDSLGGCDADEEEIAIAQSAQLTEQAQSQAFVEPQLHSATAATPVSSSSARASDDARTEECKKKYRDRIDAIDAQMRGGYSSSQGERYREQLRGLTQKLRSC